MGSSRLTNDREFAARGFDAGSVRGKTDMSRGEAARGGFGTHPNTVVH
jgi:hypothetical protein